jgi:hypothetical protein
MANKNLRETRQLAARLQTRLTALLEKRARLEDVLKAGFDPEALRQLSLVQNSIECCQNRISGRFDARAGMEVTINRLVINNKLR